MGITSLQHTKMISACSHTSNARASMLYLFQREERYLTFTRARGNYMVTSSIYMHPSVCRLLGYTDILIVSDKNLTAVHIPPSQSRWGKLHRLPGSGDGHSCGQEIPCSVTWRSIIVFTECACCLSTQRQLNLVHTFITYFSKLHFNVILPSISQSGRTKILYVWLVSSMNATSPIHRFNWISDCRNNMSVFSQNRVIGILWG